MKSKRTVSLVLPLAAAVFAALTPAPAAAESMSAAADAAVGRTDAVCHTLREPLPV